MSKGYLTENFGPYPVYSSQTANNGKIGSINTFDFDGEYISWTTDGANAGTVFYRTGKFSITNVCGLITLKSKCPLIYKFLFYWLTIEAKKHVYSGMGNPKLMSHQVENIPVPIPCPDNPEKSLAIQSEIVRILDKFSALTAALTAELSMRKKQYNYYRDQLLSLEEDEIEWKALDDVCALISAGGDVPENSVKGQVKPTNEYPYPIYANATDEKGLYGYTDSYKIDSDAVTISARGAKVGYHTVRDAKFTPIIRLIVLVANKNLVRTRYLNYVLDMTAIGGTDGGIPQLTVPMVKKITVPIPFASNPNRSLAEQDRIIAILDKFEILTNSINEGLPREINLRQKQYEYYRDLLLSFPKSNV
ncbi:restriction endonuclease subunit S [Escherichia coli]|uniref:restriction endonuclease subunit S n=1 Tax=Escherichia coli TaxID=562 RepID=UPI003B5951D6